MVAANRTGTQNEVTQVGGENCIVNPWGEVVAEASKDDEVIVSGIDLQEVINQRRRHEQITLC